jgi:hypothetical protein
VREILEISIMAGGYRGRELLERCIILEGLMGLQVGLSPKSIGELLLSFLGEEIAAAYETECAARAHRDLESYLKNLDQSQTPGPAPSLLSHLFNKLGDAEIRQCLKEISTLDLASTLKSLDAGTQVRIFNNLPKPAALFLRETMDHLSQVPPAAMDEAHARIESVVKAVRRRMPPPKASGCKSDPAPA